MEFLRPDFLLFASLFLLFVGVVAFNRITRTHKVYLLFHFTMMLWPLGQFAVFTTDLPRFQLFYLNLSFIALSLLGPGWLIFVLFLIQKSSSLRSWRVAGLVVPVLFCVTSVLWNPNGLFVEPTTDFHNRVYGPLFWIMTLIQFAYFFIALLYMFQALRVVKSVNERKQLATTLVGMFVLTLFAAIDLLVNVLLNNWLPVIPGLMSLGILLSDICFIVAIYRYGSYDILGIARSDVFEQVGMGIIVIDEECKVLEVNRGARSFVQLERGDHFEVGRFLDPLQASSEVGEFLYRYKHHPGERIRTEVALSKEGTGKFVSIQISPVLDPFRSTLGRVISFHDVTELRKLVDEMNRKNEALHERNLELIAIQDELYRANQKLEQLAITDVLTGCYNRRYLIQRLEHELMLEHDQRAAFAILLFDIDHFKQFNDRYGHLVGDEVLRATSHAVRSALRRHDLFARYGGEEFTIYLPHTEREEAEVIAESVMKAVSDNCILAGGEKIGITISMGIVYDDGRVVNSVDAKDYLRDLFQRADTALYKAKGDGRNRAVYAHQA